MIYPKIKYNIVPPSSSTKTFRNGVRNGLIPSATRLRCDIYSFAEISVNDITLAHGVLVCSVFISVLRVVDAVNNTCEFDIIFPHHSDQKYISQQFKKESKARFDCVVGCIDGMLLWMDQPTNADCEKTGVGQKYFVCGQKKKFGLNMQTIVDDKRRFININILHPSASSNYLVFTVSNLKRRLEDGLLASGKVIFGNIAYINT